MSFLRPELAARLTRGREVLVWGAALALGLGLVWRGYARLEPLVLVLGTGLVVAGFALLRGALVRLRLEAAAPGPGVVVIDEGRIGVYGPAGGGFVDLAGLASVAIEGGPGDPARIWVLRGEDGGRLVIPFGAAGADALPDALAALPGLDLAPAAARNGFVWRRDRAATDGPAPPRIGGDPASRLRRD